MRKAQRETASEPLGPPPSIRHLRIHTESGGRVCRDALPAGPGRRARADGRRPCLRLPA